MPRPLRIALVLLVLVAASLSVLVTLAWEPDQPVDVLSARWAPPPSQFITVDGMRMHYRDEGPKGGAEPPIVLLHGTSASLHTWQAWADALRPHRRVIRLDLPGFGLTGPFATGDYAMPHYVRVTGQFLDALGVGSAVFVGNSFGGNIAWHTALATPERVKALVLIDASGYVCPPVSVPIGFRLAQISWLAPLTEHLLPASAVAASLRNVYGDPSKVTPALIDRYRALTLRAGNRHAVIERFRQVPQGADAERIVELELPTLVLWGAEDRLIPRACGERFARDIAGSRLVVLEGLGHVPHGKTRRARWRRWWRSSRT
jgi:pimeloyl-ACP methyl ester carboxylesterase